MPAPVRRILRELSNNEALIVTIVDKGGKVVVLDSIQYTKMCLIHLDDQAYESVDGFGSGRVEVRIADYPSGVLSEDFVKQDPADHLLHMQCQQLTLILNKLARSGDISAKERRALIPGQPYSGSIPRFYGLPKVHKLGQLKLRPIISTIG